MRTLSTIGLLATTVLCGAGCGGGSSQAESVVKERIAAMNNFSDAIDSGDAERIKGAIPRLKEAKANLDKLDKSSAEVKALVQKYKEEMSQANKRLVETPNKAQKSGKLTPEMLKELPDVGAI